MSEDRGPFPLRGTVKRYHLHFLVGTGYDRTDWRHRIEEGDSLLGQMAADVRARRGGERSPKLTAIDLPAEAGDRHPVAVFPAGVLYPEVGPDDWERLLAHHLRTDEPFELDHAPIERRWILVCTHRSRDERCGERGIPILEELRSQIRERALRGVEVHATSHVGGHKYAGNVLIYPEGIWYGYVEPGDVGAILDGLESAAVLEELYRGRMRR